MKSRESLSLLVIVLFGLACITAGCQAETPSEIEKSLAAVDYLQESKEEKDARMKWWREARFGMFIHWGLYAVPAGDYKGVRSERIGEWIQAWANIPREEYEQFANEFNPVQFDAAEWVRIAKEAGMKYLVITSKHHDGFSIFDSEISDYDIVDSTPYGKDVIADLSRECKKQGVRFCFYHSIMDWHHPSQYVEEEGKHPTAGHGQNKIYEDQKQEYVEYMKTQLRELVTKYDPEVLWFDGEWVDWWTEEDGKDLYNYVRNLKPSIIINNRVGKGRQGMQGLNKGPGYAGDFGTPEQEIPPTGLPGIDWESCMTMNKTWGFKSYDEDWKSTETLLRNMIDIASKGGNYLLNVGPTADGLIPEPSVKRLQEMGQWLAVNGDSIYATQAGPFEALEWGRATRKGNLLYLHVFDWPKGELRVPALQNEVKKAYLLAQPDQTLKVNKAADALTIAVPGQAPDPIATVVVLELDIAPSPVTSNQ
jgi:alpha-L-fucosidase